MKKKIFFYILLLTILIKNFEMVDAWIFPAPPAIMTDKPCYFPDENINITAEWNLYCDNNSIFEIKILFLENQPNSYSSLNTMFSSSLTTIPIPTNDSSLHDFEQVSYFTTVLNSSELFNLSFENTKEIWVTLIFYLWIGGEINAASLIKTFCEISLQKYEPSFQNSLSNYSFEIGDNYLLNNTILASENSKKMYPTKEVLCIITNEITCLSKNMSSLIQDGQLTLNISKFGQLSVGTYNITFILDFTKFFCNSNLTLIMNIKAKYVEISSLNSTNIPMSYDIKFFFDFQLLDQWGKSFIIENFTWLFNSDLNWSECEILEDFYRIYFEFPKIEGEYYINLSLDNFEYNVQSYSKYFHFYKEEVDLNLYLRNITLNQEISFLVEENLGFSLESIEKSNLNLEFFDGDIWISIDYNIIEKYPSIMKIVTSWSIFENFPQFLQNSYFYSRITFLGNEVLLSATSNILTINLPIINFTVNSTSIILGQKIQFLFENYSIYHPESYFWDFGDGIGYSTEINPVYQYLFPGNYSITLTTLNFEGYNNTFNRVGYILVDEDRIPLAKFEISQNLTIQNETIDFIFTGDEGNGPCTYLWDFGDGFSSNEKNPTHRYNTQGNYSISLTIIDCNHDSSQIIKNDLVGILFDELPIANFWFKNEILIINQEILFFYNGTIGNGNETYLWNFGDGTFSMEKNPVKTYNNTGSYSISVEVTDCDGDTDLIIQNEIINIETDIFPIADFNSSNQSFLTNEEIFFFFNGTEGNGVNLFEWNIGNLIFHERNPIVVFNASGSYSIRLSIIDSNGDKDSIQKDNFIIILEDLVPEVDFFCPIKQIVANEDVQFFYNGTIGNGNETYMWNFGDGTFSTEKNPVKCYNNIGIFSIRVEITDSDGDTMFLQKDDFIIILEDFLPVADFYCLQNKIIGGEEVQFFYNGTMGNEKMTYSWEFGDNTSSNEENPKKRYSIPGNYTIKLKVTDFDGDINFKLLSNYIEVLPDYFPEAEFNYSQNTSIAGESIQFMFTGSLGNGNLTYYWKFGEHLSSSLSNPIISFEYPGIYSVFLQIMDEDGDIGTLTKENVVNIIPDIHPKSNFTCSQNTSIAGESIQFTFTGSLGNGNLSYYWKFGEHLNSSLPNPIVSFEYPGIYSVFLQIMDEDGDIGTLTKENVVNIIPDIHPKSNFTCSQNTSIAGESIQFTFTGSLGNGNLSYYWKFGEHLNSSLQNPIVSFEHPGEYSISLFISDIDGDIDYLTKKNSINIYPDLKPIAHFYFNSSSFVTGKGIQFYFNGTNGNGNITWTWNFGDGSISKEINPIKQYEKPGNYVVSIIVVDDDGDKDIFSLNIDIKRDNWIEIFPFSIITSVIGTISILTRKYWKKKIKLVALNSIKI
ncbi:hypothetical protein NEF87_002709 [Candidatus Lokiarchaeum ossiferum]|uniref:PKD domain-containing protein n=1 Tax=Candidatus Lokiarchaeum ossiferum TaxID=2951803 RepID=A0ABY6HVD9_9ARCH|nr:hypothetical protein NEF87_002709 [Candidatus Lokiarchaeum sp. B-35]